MKLIFITYRAFRKVFYSVGERWNKVRTKFHLKLNKVEIGHGFVSNGFPVIRVKDSGKMKVGINLRLNNGPDHNVIGRQQPCHFLVYENAALTIGKNVGISCSSLICQKGISIGNNVKIGGNTVIYDSDFHSLHPNLRMMKVEDKKFINSKEVVIGDNVFIGAHSTIMKGVTIGENAIIGACSVVTRSVPPNEIWGGNPAKFIKSANVEQVLQKI